MPDGDQYAMKYTDIPLTLGDALWVRVDSKHITDQTVSSLRAHHNEQLTALKSVHVTHNRVKADKYQTDATNQKRSYDSAMVALGKLRQDYATKVTKAKERIAAIDEAVSRVPDGPEPQLRKAIAEAFREMKPEDRRKKLAWALKADDRATLGAVLFWGPSFLYGMEPEERDLYIAEYQLTRYPDALATRAAIEEAIAIAEAGFRSTEKAITGLFDESSIRDAEARAYNAAKALEGK